MPPLTDYQVDPLVKVLVIGNSGGGKTGALASLASEGYNLRILDFDNNLSILKNLLVNWKKNGYKEDSISRVQSVTLTDSMKAAGGKVFPSSATAWVRAVNLLDKWKIGDEDLGSMTSWGPMDVMVIDTLTRMSESAYNFNLAMNNKLLNPPTGYEYQRLVGNTQGQLIEPFLHMLCSAEIKCNVIVNSHITYMDKLGTNRGGQEEVIPQQGFPSSLGKALSPRVPRTFGSVIIAEKVGLKHFITVKSPLNIDTKTSAPSNVLAQYPIETGLADYFKAVRSGAIAA